MLIREAELDLAEGLNAITGETGAGKTILSQAIGLLLGAKGDAGAIGADGDEAYVEAELDLPESKVYGVVTFYDLFHQKPVGRHRIRVCTNLSCQIRGSSEIMDTLRQDLGVGEEEVTPDGRCSYVHFECLGSCDTAPMMMVDDDYHENLTPKRARDIVRGLK